MSNLMLVALVLILLVILFVSIFNPKIPFYIFIASIPLEFLISDTFYTLPKVLGLIAFLFFLLPALKNNREIRIDKTIVVIFLFLIWGSLSFFWSDFKDLSLSRILTVILILIMYFLIINEVDSKKSIDDLMKYSILGGAVLGFSGLYDLIQSSSSLQRISGISQNSNIYFTMAIFMIPCIYWNLVINKGRMIKIFTFVIMLILLFTSLYTQSRGGIISLGIFMISYLLFTRKKFSWISIILIVGLATVVIAPESFWNRFFDQGYSSTDRFTALWPAGIQAAKERILTGYGIGVSEKIIPKFLNTSFLNLSVHNSLLALLIDLGLPGSILYLLAIALPTAQVFKLCCISKKSQRTYLENFGVVLFCALLAYLASWLKSGGFEYYKYIWVLVGLESCIVWLIKKQKTFQKRLQLATISNEERKSTDQ